MYATCPACDTKFVVPLKKIGEGRKVRCSQCKHEWFQKPIAEDEDKKKAVSDAPSATDPIPEGGGLPSKFTNKNNIILIISKYATYTMAFVVFLSVLLMSGNAIIKAAPFTEGFFSLFGIYRSDGMKLYDITVERVKDGKFENLLINAAIVNESDNYRQVPDVRIRLHDKEGDVLTTHSISRKEQFLQPGDEASLSETITKFPQAASRVVLDIGNKLDLTER
tara:strand:- start:2114 stop:2779 length:666 start_codon:yes stop_codon:yes gene_type:complete